MFEFLQPPGWAKPSGYANGIAARGTMIFVAGQIGWNEQCKFESDDLVEQTGQTLKNVAAVLRAMNFRQDSAGAPLDPSDVSYRLLSDKCDVELGEKSEVLRNY